MKKNITRREFIRKGSTGALVLTAAACAPRKAVSEQDGTDDIPGEMTYRTNPKNGDKVSLLGYGCMRWPTNRTEGKEEIDQEAVNQLVDYAIEHGVNYFDAAPVYLMGQCEKATGTALSRYPRSSYYVATKMSNFSNSDFDNSVLMYKKSLENFRTDYIDYYLLHSVKNPDDFNKRFAGNGLIDYLLEEREKGNIRNLGVSFHGSFANYDYLMELHRQYHWDFIQIQMNYVDWNHASGRNSNASYLYAKAVENGIPVVIMEPLLGGRLANVPDFIAETYLERRPSDSVASWAFRFAGSPAGVLTVLSGMTYMEHLQDNMKTFCPLIPLSEEELELLEHNAKIINDFPTIKCTDCKYCMPCPYGIDIPGLFIHYNKCVNEGMVVKVPENTDEDDNLTPEEKKARKEYRKMRRNYLISYSRAVPAIRQASNCIACGKCNSNCPQHIDIPKLLEKIDQYIEGLRRG